MIPYAMARISILPLVVFVFLSHLQTTNAANNVILKNHCPYDFYYWVVGLNYTGFSNDEEHLTVPAGSTYSHAMVVPVSGGISLKISSRPTYQQAPQPVLQIEYHLGTNDGLVYYDLSAVDCNFFSGPEDKQRCAFAHDGGMALYPSPNLGCPKVSCSLDSCEDTYHEHGTWLGEPSFHCDAGVDIIFEACKSTIDEPAPEPSSAVAPWPAHAIPSTQASWPTPVYTSVEPLWFPPEPSSAPASSSAQPSWPRPGYPAVPFSWKRDSPPWPPQSTWSATSAPYSSPFFDRIRVQTTFLTHAADIYGYTKGITPSSVSEAFPSVTEKVQWPEAMGDVGRIKMLFHPFPGGQWVAERGGLGWN
ncbi:hypothetical protein GQ43DRAFT_154936 [Delitschia confertaspora ATCC 74209]|uniref:Chitin-binding type-4 domain-containing protein n=1 Tax=Delitschia confertaspora ATCC 74209 TaxID=1513339 RepID=A0A9P4JHS4_9PLEO|nr:hypothetical protein GQ43DRAFT_154936 [Delitschia confertaspora ATCC 74209]